MSCPPPGWGFMPSPAQEQPPPPPPSMEQQRGPSPLWPTHVDHFAEQFMPKPAEPTPEQGGVGEGPKKKARKASDRTDDDITLRKERNKEHAKRSRLRRKFLLESLRDQLQGLRKQNMALRQVIQQKMADVAPRILEECSTSAVFTEMRKMPGDEAEGGGKLGEHDQKLMSALHAAQQCFTICSATDAEKRITFASDGFLKMTGYRNEEVLGKPALFLQGQGTADRDVRLVREALANNTDVSVCILNYKADGKPFWNQFFLAPLCDAYDHPIFYVAVHCEVEASPLDEEIQQVIKQTPMSEMEKTLLRSEQQQHNK